MIPMTPEILSRLKFGPTILLLGQDYLRGSAASNPFVDVLRERYPDIQSTQPSLKPYLERIATEERSATMAWLHRRSQKLPISESLATVSDFAWNHVDTTAIDEVWVRAFAKSWRSLQGFFTEKMFPQDIRDRNRLCCTFLFGCVDKEDEESRCPRDELQLDDRLQVAIALLRRLPDILTPRGILIIEGWDPKMDWLSSKDIYPTLSRLGASQVAICSATPELQADARLMRLRKDGTLLFIQESLAEIISTAKASGTIALGDPGTLLPNGRQITIDSQLAFIPKDIFLQVEPFATILDDNITVPPRNLARDTEYFDFLHFIEEPVKLRNWDPFARGFPFIRDFYYSLSQLVEKCLTTPHANRAPIILHGDTGTGKTVALANLAYKTASQARFPVIFIERSSKNIGSEEALSLDRLLNWAEDAGAQACLVVWDGMRRLEDYTRLWTFLADRGRKAVIIGSFYLLPEDQRPKLSVEAPRLFNPHERDRFLEYLQRYAPEVANWVKEKDSQVDQAFLVALYRLLPQARPTIRTGVVQEFKTDQVSIFERIKNLHDKPTGFNTLEAAFKETTNLKLSTGTSDAAPTSFWSQTSNIYGETLTTIQKLFALVMTPGRYVPRIPIELVLSALNHPIDNRILEALKSHVIVWHEATNGNIFLEPRQPLEAQIYMENLFGGVPKPEACLICELIAALPRPDTEVGGEASIEFIVELLQIIGPNSKNQAFANRFLPCRLSFAEALTNVREQRSIVSNRLMLQEATLYREGAGDPQNPLPATEKILLLQKAADVMAQALDLPNISTWQRSIMSGELTACLGFLLSAELPSASRARIEYLYASALNSFNKARSAAPNNVHAIVTLGWITRPLLDKGFFTPEELPAITASLVSLFDDAEEITMDLEQQQFFLEERSKIMDLLGNTQLSEDAFQKLIAIGSKAGYYIRARSKFRDIPEGPLTPGLRDQLDEAIHYLESNWRKIETDYRCVNLLFHIWWRTLVGRRPFETERQILPFSQTQWQRCHELLDRLAQLSDPEPRPTIRFLRALAQFHVGLVESSNQEFRLLASDNSVSLGGRRLRKLYMASLEGQPLEYNGQVQHDIAEHQIGRLWVDKIHANVLVTPHDFDRRQLRRHETLNDFHIAFSFTGPIAQPQRYLRTLAHSG